MSREEFDNTIPVNPPTVKRNTKPRAHTMEGLNTNRTPWNVPSQLNTLIPVGTAIIIVAVVK